MLQICAWVFSNCGCHAEAADAYCRLLQLRPDWTDGHRHASSSLAASGQLDEAIDHALTATESAPDNADYALHAGLLLRDAGRHEEAGHYLDRAVSEDPGNGRAWCALAAVQLALDRRNDAAASAARAAGLAAADAPLMVDAAEMLLQCGRAKEAAALLQSTGASGGDARLWRVLSAAEMVDGNLEAALAAADWALAAAPANAEYHLHRALLLARLGDLPAAAEAVARAAVLEPASRDLKRTQLELFLAAGLVSEATAVGGELLQRFPDDKPAASAVLHLLTHRLDAIDGEYSVLHDGTERAVRPPRPPPSLLARLRAQRRIIGALIIRESRTRFAEHKLGYGWALIEPILHIALLSVTFAVLMHGRPPIGSQFFVFYYTGLIPYLIFIHASSAMCHAVTGNGPVLQLPPVTSFDVIAARGLLEVATDIVVAVILLVGFGAIGLVAMPDDLWGPATAVLTTAAFGCGVGYVNAVLTVFFRSWEKAYNQLTRVLYFVSGIFYVPAMMPDWARDALAWNPLLHAIDWFRTGFFAGYEPHWLDRSYLVILAILSLLAGFGLERGLRRRLSAVS
jgi:capsular polysaccharide transport system permease protein